VSTDETVDAVQLTVIEELRVNGRIPLAEIARRHDLPLKRVRSTLDELVESGRICVTPILDPSLMGYKSVALIELQLTGARPLADVVTDLAAIAESDYVAATSGPTHLFVNVISRDPASLAHLVDSQVRTVSGVRVMSTAPYVSFPYQRTARSLDASRFSADGYYELDEFESSLIRVLTEDGRMSNSAIARRLGVSEANVRNRLKKLSELGVLHVAAIVNSRSGNEEPAALVKLRDANVHGDAVARLRDLEPVTFIAQVLSDYDYIVELTCATYEELVQAIAALRRSDDFDLVSSHLCYEVRYTPMLPG
jgi:DNA-binding Lrp family transcriptional regulator